MITRLQQLIVVGLLGAAALVAYRLAEPVGAVIAAAAALLVLFSYAVLLAIQFTMLAGFGRDSSGTVAERPGLRQIIRAWTREICCTPAVFLWRQPFRSRSAPDHLVATDQVHGVILIHGYFCNRALWNPWLRRLSAAGVPCVAPSLQRGLASIEGHVDEIEASVRLVERLTGRPAVVVAHSMGGLVARYWLASQPSDATPVRRLITIGSPHHGTWMARFGHTRCGREMRPGSQFLRDLEARETERHRELFTCFYSACDNIVFPPATATLAGAHNVNLPGRPHLDMLNDPAVFAEVLRWTEATPGPKPRSS